MIFSWQKSNILIEILLNFAYFIKSNDLASDVMTVMLFEQAEQSSTWILNTGASAPTRQPFSIALCRLLDLEATTLKINIQSNERLATKAISAPSETLSMESSMSKLQEVSVQNVMLLLLMFWSSSDSF